MSRLSNHKTSPQRQQRLPNSRNTTKTKRREGVKKSRFLHQENINPRERTNNNKNINKDNNVMPSQQQLSSSSRPEYFSVESPQKQRRKSYFWSVVISLSVLIALLFAGVLVKANHLFNQKQSNTATLSTTTSSFELGENSQQIKEKLSSPTDEESSYKNNKNYYKVDMTKSSWPELVGQDAETAKETIQAENPSIKDIPIVPEDSFVTMDYSLSRVRIFVKKDNTVASPPRVG